MTLTAEATDRSVGIVGAVASGAGESLSLPLEPATRLNAIAIEAASNVVAHAYPGSSGPLELEINTPEPAVADDLRVVVRDSGHGMFAPTPNAESGGLGLTVICALADEVEIRSTAEGGTSLAAVIHATEHGEPEMPPPAPPDTDPRLGGALEFAGTSFVESVLPRTLAALVAGTTTAIDVLTEVLHIGDAIAYGLRTCLDADEHSVVCWDGDSPREVRFPLPRGHCHEVREAVASIEPRSGAWFGIEPGLTAGQDLARVNFPQLVSR